MEGISVVICTYNAARRIKPTLTHLAKQRVPAELKIEVILVDNASTDGTKEIAESIWKELSHIKFSAYQEPQQGLSFARHKGIEKSSFKYVIFCDDDNWLEKDYITNAYNIISKNSQIGALGGQSVAVSEVPIPSWFSKYSSNYAVGKQGQTSGNVTPRTFLWGSGIVINKLIYRDAFKDFPSILTGRKGKALNSGEDSEMCMRFIIMGYQLHYNENLNFKHFIGAERLTEKYNSRLQDGFIEAFNTLEVYRKFITLRNFPVLKTTSLLAKSIIKISLQLLLKRWQLESDILEVYILTGIQLGRVKDEIKQIKLLEKTTCK